MSILIKGLFWIFLLMGIFILILFTYNTYDEGFVAWGIGRNNFSEIGQFGDYFGGVVGTLFAIASTFLIYLSFQEQTKQNTREGFESTFFEMIRLHRENVSELTYTKYEGNRLWESENRKVFKVIFQEFLTCFEEVKFFSKDITLDEYLTIDHKNKLQLIIDNINKDIELRELTLIDIAYSIIYYGISKEGEEVLKELFLKKYETSYSTSLLNYIKLKPKREDSLNWENWETLKLFQISDIKNLLLVVFNKKKPQPHMLSSASVNLIINPRSVASYNKYYGGHQHRLGHYYRHLFQSYKYLNNFLHLNEHEKYLFGKTLRAQLSTYEQALLFINSISSLGMKWEFTPEIDLTTKLSARKLKSEQKNKRLISKYNLIKNLPGISHSGIIYKKYYPDVKYESDE